MRQRRKIPGIVITILGLIIILSMILPTGFWWFSFGAALIDVGLCMMKR